MLAIISYFGIISFSIIFILIFYFGFLKIKLI